MGILPSLWHPVGSKQVRIHMNAAAVKRQSQVLRRTSSIPYVHRCVADGILRGARWIWGTGGRSDPGTGLVLRFVPKIPVGSQDHRDGAGIGVDMELGCFPPCLRVHGEATGVGPAAEGRTCLKEQQPAVGEAHEVRRKALAVRGPYFSRPAWKADFVREVRRKPAGCVHGLRQVGAHPLAVNLSV